MPLELPAFPCPSCHERTFTKHAVDNDAPTSMGMVLTHLHLCHACGENYLSTVHVSQDQSRTETWDYYLDRTTTIRRVRHYKPSGSFRLTETASEFIVDGESISESAWRSALASARATPSLLVADTAAAAFADRWLTWWETTSRPHIPSSRQLPVFRPAALIRQAA